MEDRLHLSRAITLLACAGFASAVAIRVCDPMLPEIARTFGTTNGQAASTITAFAISYGLCQLIYGPLGDHYHKYRVIIAATFACTIGSLGAALSPSLFWLVLSRVLAGATGAAIIPLSMAWIGDIVPYVDRQATLGRFIAGQVLGVLGGQFLGGFAADTLGWRWCFVLLAGMYVAVGVLLQREIRRNRLIQRQLVSRLTPTSQPAFRSQFENVLRMPWARVILVIAFLESFAVFWSVAFVPVYLHTTFGISLTAAGAIMAVFGIGGFCYSLIARWLVARIGERGIALGGGLALGVAFLAFLVSGSWVAAIPASFATGMGFYMLHNTLQTNATQMVPHCRGTAVAVFVSAFFLGQSSGVFFGAIIVDHASARWLFAVSAAALPVIGAAFVSALRHRPAEYHAEPDGHAGA